MVYGYVRISTADQSADGQKSLISRYIVERKMIVDEWIEVEVSSRKTAEKRKITELLARVSANDTVVVSELSRLGRSIREVLQIVEELIGTKKCRVVLIKQGLNLDPANRHDMANKVLLTVFSMVAELERDFISERTKEGLRAQKEKGIKLGKPMGTVQKSVYDKDRKRIFELEMLGVPLKRIIDNHLGYGSPPSLKEYIRKRKTGK